MDPFAEDRNRYALIRGRLDTGSAVFVKFRKRRCMAGPYFVSVVMGYSIAYSQLS